MEAGLRSKVWFMLSVVAMTIDGCLEIDPGLYGMMKCDHFVAAAAIKDHHFLSHH